MARPFPAIVTKLINIFDSWIVGSAADPTIKTFPRDLDIIVPWNQWNAAAGLIPRDARVNTFGGWTFFDEGVEVDLWPDDIGRFLTSDFVKFAWHPRSGARFSRTGNIHIPWKERFRSVVGKTDNIVKKEETPAPMPVAPILPNWPPMPPWTSGITFVSSNSVFPVDGVCDWGSNDSPATGSHGGSSPGSGSGSGSVGLSGPVQL